jgi:hypothetical protein
LTHPDGEHTLKRTKSLDLVARTYGVREKVVGRAIESLKQANLSGHAGELSPDVLVDLESGEVYPVTQDGTVGDSIGNVQDELFGPGGRR